MSATITGNTILQPALLEPEITKALAPNTGKINKIAQATMPAPSPKLPASPTKPLNAPSTVISADKFIVSISTKRESRFSFKKTITITTSKTENTNNTKSSEITRTSKAMGHRERQKFKKALGQNLAENKSLSSKTPMTCTSNPQTTIDALLGNADKKNKTLKDQANNEIAAAEDARKKAPTALSSQPQTTSTKDSLLEYQTATQTAETTKYKEAKTRGPAEKTKDAREMLKHTTAWLGAGNTAVNLLYADGEIAARRLDHLFNPKTPKESPLKTDEKIANASTQSDTTLMEKSQKSLGNMGTTLALGAAALTASWTTTAMALTAEGVRSNNGLITLAGAGMLGCTGAIAGTAYVLSEDVNQLKTAVHHYGQQALGNLQKLNDLAALTGEAIGNSLKHAITINMNLEVASNYTPTIDGVQATVQSWTTGALNYLKAGLATLA